MRFKMPNGQDLTVECNEPDIDAEIDQEVEGVIYYLKWGKQRMRFTCKTRAHAYALALGAQWGAKTMVGENE